MSWGRLEECEYICGGCSRRVCMDEEPSPGEHEQICADCYETEDDDAAVAS